MRTAHPVSLSRVDRVLGDYPNFLYALATYIETGVIPRAELAEKLRVAAGELDLLTRSIGARFS